MDFDLSPEQQAFRESVTRWVAAEAPKSWARELERDEHNYPFALWDKLTEAGFHGIGIDEEYGGQGGDVFTQMILARALARTLGGLAWIWGITSFAGGKSIGIYGTKEQKELFLPRSPPASCARPSHSPSLAAALTCSARFEPRPCAVTAVGSSTARRSGAHRRTLRTTSCCSPGPTRTSPSATRASRCSGFPRSRRASKSPRCRSSACARWAPARFTCECVRPGFDWCWGSPGMPGTCCCRRSTTSGSWWPRSAWASSTGCWKMPWST